MLTLDQMEILNVCDVKVLRDNKELKVELNNCNINKYLDYINYKSKIPKGLEWIADYITIKPIKRPGIDLGKNILFIPFFKEPLEFKIEGFEDLFRLYSVEPYVGISKNGRFVRLDKGENRKITFLINNSEIELPVKETFPSLASESSNSYPTMDFGRKTLTTKAHRMVALVWKVDDVNLVDKFIVDHIDNNKNNYSADNLQWVSQKENKIKNNHITLDRNIKYIVKRLSDSLVYEFETLDEVYKFFKMDKDEIENIKKGLPFKFERSGDSYILYDIDEYFNKYKKLSPIYKRYNYIVIDNEGNIFLLRTTKEILEKFKLIKSRITNNYTIGLIEGFERYFKERGWKFIYKGKTRDNKEEKYKIQAKNLATGEIIEEPSTKKMGERLGVSKSAIITRLNGNHLEGVPLIAKDGSEWLIRKSTEDFPEIKELKVGKRVPVIVIEDDKELVFNSLREAEVYTGISRETLSKKSRLINNRRIIQL